MVRQVLDTTAQRAFGVLHEILCPGVDHILRAMSDFLGAMDRFLGAHRPNRQQLARVPGLRRKHLRRAFRARPGPRSGACWARPVGRKSRTARAAG